MRRCALRWLVGVALGLAGAPIGCGVPEPTFPAATVPPGAVASVECRAMQRVFPALLATQTKGNVVLSPHAVVRALVLAGAGGDDSRRAQILAFLGHRGSWQELESAIVSAEGNLEATGILADEGMPVPRFSYEAVLRRLADEPSSEELLPGKPLQSDFNRQELDRARLERPPQHVISMIDARIAGVPRRTLPLFRPTRLAFGERESVAGVHMRGATWYGVSRDFKSAFWAAENDGWDTVPARLEGRAIIAMSLPAKVDAVALERLPVIPCSGGGLPEGGDRVFLEARAPTFCARTRFSLLAVAPELRAILPGDVELRARLAFDERGTINLPEHAVRSPSFLNDISLKRTAHELNFTRPFLVTVHARDSGAILYVASVREPNDVKLCQ